MVNVNEAFEIKYKKAGEQFEVLVDFDKLKEYQKKPTETSVYDVLADTKIFKDQKKGEIASENILKKTFPNQTEEQILREILIKGECQIPTSYLNKLREERKKQAINYIAENAINPATKMKYTLSMIENEVNKIKYNFDPHSGFEHQAEEVLKLLKKVMPISIDKVTLEIEIPIQYSGAFYGPFRKFGHITKEYHDKNSNLRLHMEISESSADKAIEYIKKHTNNEGSYFIKKN